MDWKEIFKISVIVGVVIIVLQIVLSFVQREYVIVSTLLGPLAVGFILNKKLKDDWSALIGMIVTFLVTVVVTVVLDTLGIFSVV